MTWRRLSEYAIESEDGKLRVSRAETPAGLRYVRWRRVGPGWHMVGVYETADEAKQQQRSIGGR